MLPDREDSFEAAALLSYGGFSEDFVMLRALYDRMETEVGAIQFLGPLDLEKQMRHGGGEWVEGIRRGEALFSISTADGTWRR